MDKQTHPRVSEGMSQQMKWQVSDPAGSVAGSFQPLRPQTHVLTISVGMAAGMPHSSVSHIADVQALAPTSDLILLPE